MFYRENGQFKTSYAADQQIFGVAQDRWVILLVLAIGMAGRKLGRRKVWQGA
jgi:glutathionyl-hydroquinone reductase